jgi:hypothetical protein
MGGRRQQARAQEGGVPLVQVENAGPPALGRALARAEPGRRRQESIAEVEPALQVVLLSVDPWPVEEGVALHQVERHLAQRGFEQPGDARPTRSEHGDVGQGPQIEGIPVNDAVQRQGDTGVHADAPQGTGKGADDVS